VPKAVDELAVGNNGAKNSAPSGSHQKPQKKTTQGGKRAEFWWPRAQVILKKWGEKAEDSGAGEGHLLVRKKLTGKRRGPAGILKAYRAAAAIHGEMARGSSCPRGIGGGGKEMRPPGAVRTGGGIVNHGPGNEKWKVRLREQGGASPQVVKSVLGARRSLGTCQQRGDGRKETDEGEKVPKRGRRSQAGMGNSGVA